MIGSSVVAKRYAQALFDLAGEEKDYIKFQGELKEMNSLIDGAADLKEFFINPVFEDAEKKALPAAETNVEKPAEAPKPAKKEAAE